MYVYTSSREPRPQEGVAPRDTPPGGWGPGHTGSRMELSALITSPKWSRTAIASHRAKTTRVYTRGLAPYCEACSLLRMRRNKLHRIAPKQRAWMLCMWRGVCYTMHVRTKFIQLYTYSHANLLRMRINKLRSRREQKHRREMY